MGERPILFSAPMVRAILEGRKTQTRRVAKFQFYEGQNPHFSGYDPGTYMTGGTPGTWVLRSRGHGSCWNDRTKPLDCPYGKPGDRLWVRETWAGERNMSGGITVAYRASCENDEFDLVEGSTISRVQVKRWRPSIFMPRDFSRITLEVTSVRVERLQDISEMDAIAEGVARDLGRDVPAAMGGGVEPWRNYIDGGNWVTSARASFRTLWDSINGKRDGASWAANPWIWAISFKRVEVAHAA